MIATNATMIAMQAAITNQGSQDERELFDVDTTLLGIAEGTLLGIVGGTLLDLVVGSLPGVAIGP
jgi:hypothetical protein